MPRLSTLAATAALTILAGCGAKTNSDHADYSSPTSAVRSLIESARAGDHASAHAALVARERGGDGKFAYDQMRTYEISRVEQAGEGEAVVYVLIDESITTPMACELEEGEWRVTMWGSMQAMQKQMQQGAMPR